MWGAPDGCNEEEGRALRCPVVNMGFPQVRPSSFLTSQMSSMNDNEGLGVRSCSVTFLLL